MKSNNEEEAQPEKKTFQKIEENPEEAEKRKLAGNEALKAGNLELAIELYTEGLQYHYNEAILTNRAAAYIQKRKYKDALQDCE